MNFKTWRILFFIIVAAALITRLWRIGDFNHPIFDEVYYSTFTTQYLKGTPFVDAHPPMGRFIFTLLAKIGGADPNQSFETTEVPYGSFPYRLLRLGAAFGGILLIIFLMLFVKEFTKSASAGLFAGFLALFENSLVIESRYILPEIFILAFGVGGLWLFVRKDRERRFSRKWYWYFTLAGIFFGLAIGTKVSGFVFLGAAWFIYLLIQSQDKRPLIHFMFIFILLVPILIFFALTVIHFAIVQSSGPVLNVIGNIPGYETVTLFDKIREQPIFNKPFGRPAQLFLESAIGSLLTVGAHLGDYGSHPAASPWYSWPFMHKPIVYAHEDNKAVFLLGNPLIWAGGLVALLVLLVRNFKDRSFKFGAPLILAYFLNLALFALAPRPFFLYHYLPSLVFLIVITAIVLEKLAKEKPKLAYGFLILNVISFVIISPLTYGL